MSPIPEPPKDVARAVLPCQNSLSQTGPATGRDSASRSVFPLQCESPSPAPPDPLPIDAQAAVAPPIPSALPSSSNASSPPERAACAEYVKSPNFNDDEPLFSTRIVGAWVGSPVFS